MSIAAGAITAWWIPDIATDAGMTAGWTILLGLATAFAIMLLTAWMYDTLVGQSHKSRR